jgi:hypothetical protein
MLVEPSPLVQVDSIQKIGEAAHGMDKIGLVGPEWSRCAQRELVCPYRPEENARDAGQKERDGLRRMVTYHG